MTSAIEQCLGPVDRLVIWSGHEVVAGLPNGKGPLTFIVDLVEEGPEGGCLGMWHGPTYQAAVQAAREISQTLGPWPIVDNTDGAVR